MDIRLQRLSLSCFVLFQFQGKVNLHVPPQMGREAVRKNPPAPGRRFRDFDKRIIVSD
jgi:hypothetical protein